MSDQILLVFGLVFEVLAALGVPSGRFNFTAAGIACFIATLLF